MILLKHYCQLTRNIASLSDGQARVREAEAGTEEEDSLTTILVTVTPRSGPYRGGKFDFELDVSEGYPSCPPVVRAQTTMYHPNVDCSCDYGEGEVCLNILDELWSPEMTLDDVVQGLLFLLQEPNLEDPLSSMFDGTEEEEEFRRNVRRSLRGGVSICDVHFERNLMDGYDSECEEEDEVAPGNQENASNTAQSKEAQIEMETILIRNCTNINTEQQDKIHSTQDTSPPPSPPSLPACPVDTTHTGTDSAHSPIESSVDKVPPLSPLYSQQDIVLNSFHKMWTFSLSSIIRTIVLGAQRTPVARLDSPSGVR